MPTRQEIEQAKGTVAVIGGTGALGFGLALRWAIAGVPVVIGSRRPDAAKDAAKRLREHAGSASAEPDLISGAVNAEAAGLSRTVCLCVPFNAQIETLKSLRQSLDAGTLLVDTTVPLAATLGGKPTHTLGLWQGSAAEQAAEHVPRGVHVVSALHTVSGAALQDLSKELAEDVLVCGDDPMEKKRLVTLIERIPGLRAVNCGPLEMARITEQLPALLIGINRRYRVKHSGIRLTSLPEELW